ncbi:hypothetical protein ACGFX8_06095 [Streptomyces sp. NPDC048362]|uniref:hypothetical protein n=1 Tax=Streptomyces sp. NPDC048362 TaxID=3365539 RepID=UPI003711D2F5
MGRALGLGQAVLRRQPSRGARGRTHPGAPAWRLRGFLARDPTPGGQSAEARARELVEEATRVLRPAALPAPWHAEMVRRAEHLGSARRS